MANQSTRTPCPGCLPDRVNYLDSRPGSQVVACAGPAGPGPHKYEDLEQLKAALAWARQTYPQYYKGATPPSPPPRQSAPIQLDPETQKLVGELAGHPVTETIIGTQVLAELEQFTGEQITGGADIKGIVYEAIQGRKDAEAELANLRSRAMQSQAASVRGNSGSPAIAPGQFVVTSPEWAEEAIKEAAIHTGKSVAEWINDEFGAYLEQVFTPAGASRR